MGYIVKLEGDSRNSAWLCRGEGDPPRTLKRTHARRFDTKARAERAIAKARRFRPFANAVIEETAEVFVD